MNSSACARYLLGVAFIVALSQSHGWATAISVNIVAGGGSVGANTAGVVPLSNWNDVPYSTGPASQALNTDSGASSGLSVSIPLGYSTFQASPNFAASGDPNAVGDNALMSGHIYRAGGANVDLNFSGSLPFSTYDLYVYYNSGGVTNTQTFTVFNGANPVASATGSEVPGSDTQFVLSTGANDANYVIIPGLTLATFKLEAQFTSGGGFSYINGVQLVGVPEPSSWCLLAIGAVAFGTIARRRRRSPA